MLVNSMAEEHEPGTASMAYVCSRMSGASSRETGGWGLELSWGFLTHTWNLGWDDLKICSAGAASQALNCGLSMCLGFPTAWY